MATVIPAEGPVRELQPGRGASFQLEELQAVVGGYIEALYLPEAVMFLDEDGKAKGRPINPRATALAAAVGKLKPTDCIVGDVIICTPAEAGDGDEDEEDDDDAVDAS